MELILDSLDYAEDRPQSGFSSGGELHFALGNAYFPGEHWYDCVYQNLITWLPGLISFGSNHTDSCGLSFMDGPYTARLSRLPDGSITVFCFYDHRLVTEKKISFVDFLRSVTACLRKYDRFLFEHGKETRFSKEIKQLKNLLDT